MPTRTPGCQDSRISEFQVFALPHGIVTRRPDMARNTLKRMGKLLSGGFGGASQAENLKT